jgi:hypothetical protein
MSVDVFISHSSQDSELAAHLVDLLRSALNLRVNQVRCTSVDGYRLPVGADSDEQLRDEALEATTFIGILSPFSLASAYVLFELGARWGAKKAILPLLAPGVGPQALRGPLTGINALSCESAGQLHQLVSDVAGALGVGLESAAVYQRHVDAIVYLSRSTAASAAPQQAPSMDERAQLRAEPAQPRQTASYVEAEEILRLHCEREWPDDFNMRAYCMKQQREAVARLREGRPSNIPEDVFASVRAKCARAWPDDYSMRIYSEQQQFDAYRELNAQTEKRSAKSSEPIFLTLVGNSFSGEQMDLALKNDGSPFNILNFDVTTPGAAIRQWHPRSLSPGDILRAPTTMPGHQLTECIYEMKLRDRSGVERVFRIVVDARVSPPKYDFVEIG